MQTISKDGMSYFISDQGDNIYFLEAWEFPNAALAIADMVSKGYTIIGDGNISTYPSKSGNSYRIFFNKPEDLVDLDLSENKVDTEEDQDTGDFNSSDDDSALDEEIEQELAKELAEDEVNYSQVDFTKAEKMTKPKLIEYAKTFDIELDPDQKKKDLLVDLTNAVEALTQ
jgi:hypothetical protein